MGEDTSQSARPNSSTPRNRWSPWWLRLILLIWVLQLAWLGWQLREEIGELASKGWHHAWGEAVQQEDPFCRWLADLKQVIPPHATYLFVDNYEAGKEIEARYHLFPRRHLLFSPQASPSLLFHSLRQHQVSHLLVRDATQPLGPGIVAAMQVGVAKPLVLPGPGLTFRVDPTLISGGFYD